MPSPIILLTGTAGSGKDTIAGFMAKNHKAQQIAHADPMKRLCRYVFGFSEHTLWGPSSARNAPQSGYLSQYAWEVAGDNLSSHEARSWLEDVFQGSGYDLPHLQSELRTWYYNAYDQTFKANKPFTARFALQTLGTEFGRNLGKNIWSDYTIRAAFNLLSGGYRYDHAAGLYEDDSATGPEWVVITDGRFRNEVVNVLKVGGYTVQVTGGTFNTDVEKAGVAGHASEKEQTTIPRHFFSAFFQNDKQFGLEAAERTTTSLVRGLSWKYSQVHVDTADHTEALASEKTA